MIKIAAACDQGQVSQHFGHCSAYEIFTADEAMLVASTSVPNPGHAAGLPPDFLDGLGVNVVISGGMGGAAISLFNEMGVIVVTGATGEAAEVAQKYLDGTLESTGAACHEHSGGSDCAH